MAVDRLKSALRQMTAPAFAYKQDKVFGDRTEREGTMIPIQYTIAREHTFRLRLIVVLHRIFELSLAVSGCIGRIASSALPLPSCCQTI